MQTSLTIMVIHALLSFALLTLASSPYELARADNHDKIIGVLAKLRNIPEDDVVKEANLITKDVENEKLTRKINMLDTLKKMDLKKLAIILVVFSMPHLSGILVLTTFLVDIFSPTGISIIVLVSVVGISEMVFSFFHMMIADRFGRYIIRLMY